MGLGTCIETSLEQKMIPHDKCDGPKTRWRQTTVPCCPNFAPNVGHLVRRVPSEHAAQNATLERSQQRYTAPLTKKSQPSFRNPDIELEFSAIHLETAIIECVLR